MFNIYGYQLHFEQVHSENLTSRPSNHQSLAPNSTKGDVSNLLTNDHPAAASTDIRANAAAAISSSVLDCARGIASGQYRGVNCGVCGVFIRRNLLRSHVCINEQVGKLMLIKSFIRLLICEKSIFSLLCLFTAILNRYIKYGPFKTNL